MENQEKKPSRQPEKNPLKNYATYSALGFQMMAIILIGLYVGIKLDELFELQYPIFTLILTLFGLGMALYFLFRQVLKK